MEELVRVAKTEGGRNVVSARELHAFLVSGQEFSHWIKNRIEKYGFVENEDFKVFDKVVKNPRGGRPLIEYDLTLDMAKELAMVEGNERGRQIRRYFIACEERLRESAAPHRVRDPRSAALIEALVKLDAVEREQERQAAELAGARAEIALLGAKVQPDAEEFTVMGWARLRGIALPLCHASTLGKLCSRISRERGLPWGKVRDSRFGRVNTYREPVLEEAFDAFFGNAHH